MLRLPILVDIVCVIILVDYGNSLTCPKQVHDSSNYIGCLANYGYDRIFPHLYNGNGYHPKMENSRCILYCKGKGYNYAGTAGNKCLVRVNYINVNKKAQYQQNTLNDIVLEVVNDDHMCYCGTNSFLNGRKIDDYYHPNSECDDHCRGDSTQFCGGNSIISVYETGFHSLNIQNTFYRALAKDYKLTTQTRRVIRISSVSHCASHCLSTTSCRAFETCMDTAECRLIFDYETLCDGIQHEVGYVIYMLQ